MPSNDCYTLVELFNFMKENEMPCAPCTPTTPPNNDCVSECPLHPAHAECCSGDIGLGHQLHLCRYPTGCGDATYPVGMNLNVNSWPNTGRPVFSYRAFDCTDGISETGMMVHNPTTGARTGFYAGLRQVPGVSVSGVATRLVDGASNVIPGSSFTTSVYDPSSGEFFSAIADGVLRVDGGLVLQGDIVDGAGNVLVSGSGGTGGTPANPITDVSISGSTLTFTYADATTENITLPAGSGTDAIVDSDSGLGQVVGDPAWVSPLPAQHYELAVPSEFDSDEAAVFGLHNTSTNVHTSVVGLVKAVEGHNAVVGSVINASGVQLAKGHLGAYISGVLYAAYLDGNVHITGAATCTAGGWSDHVFEQGYELPDFSQFMTDTYERGAFPEMPTAEEAAEKLDLANFAKQILEKVEMIYLYHDQLRSELTEKGVL